MVSGCSALLELGTLFNHPLLQLISHVAMVTRNMRTIRFLYSLEGYFKVLARAAALTNLLKCCITDSSLSCQFESSVLVCTLLWRLP